MYHHRSCILSISRVSKFLCIVSRNELKSSITSYTSLGQTRIKYKNELTFTTSTGSFFMLFGQVNSGRFSGSPGRSKILRRFLTSSIRSLAALESSRRSFLTIKVRGSWVGWRCSEGKFLLIFSQESAGFEDDRGSRRAAANISAEAMTRRSEDVNI